MIAGLLFTGLLLGLACAWTRRTSRDEFTRAGHVMGFAGLACWGMAFIDLFMRAA